MARLASASKKNINVSKEKLLKNKTTQKKKTFMAAAEGGGYFLFTSLVYKACVFPLMTFPAIAVKI